MREKMGCESKAQVSHVAVLRVHISEMTRRDHDNGHLLLEIQLMTSGNRRHASLDFRTLCIFLCMHSGHALSLTQARALCELGESRNLTQDVPKISRWNGNCSASVGVHA